MGLMPMQKIAIFFPRSERENLLAMLQGRGSVEILDLKETPLAEAVEISELGAGTDADRIASDIGRAIDDLSEFEEKGGMFGGFGGGKVMVGEDEFAAIASDFDFETVLSEVEQLESRRTELRTKRNHLEAFIERLTPWKDLDVPVEELGQYRDVRIVAGAVAGGDGPEVLAEALGTVSETFSIDVVNRTERNTYIVVFYHRDEGEAVAEVLRKQDLEIQAFEGIKGLPRDLVADARNQIDEVNREIEALVSNGSELVKHKPKLMIAHDYFTQEARKAHAQALIGTTETVGVMQGWVRKQDLDQVRAAIETAVEAAEVLTVEPDEGESPPIELKNRRWMRPFEVITELYGMPHAREVDPTPLAGPFFALFFGFCLTDAGYGIVLVALSLLLMKYLKANRKFLWLICIGGLMTVLMGAITGGWFGLTDDTMPSWLGALGSMRRALMQFDPLENPMLMFGLALALGFIQVIFGLVVEMVENFRAGDFAAGFFDQVTWIVLLCSAVLFGLTKMGPVPAGYAAIAKWGAIGAAVGIVGFTHREGNPGIRIGWGLYNLYGATGFLGDVLSYARLLALGLATGGIAMVINAVAIMVKGIPVVGIPVMIFVLAAGHTLNIAVNALGGFVHSARLQYVEFYPKFFEGGGRRFRPFSRELKYTRLVEKAN
jgi:V/A-type H+-transporting ATPase subunit I